MSKATLKLNRNVQKALQLAQPLAQQYAGFSQFRYRCAWHDFPGSLILTCYFEDREALQAFLQQHHDTALRQQLQQCFLKVGIKFKAVHRNIVFSEQPAETDQ